MFCVNCGNKLNDDDVFCPFCGSKVREEVIDEVEEEIINDYANEEDDNERGVYKKKDNFKRKNGKWIFRGLVFVAILIIAVYLYLQPKIVSPDKFILEDNINYDDSHSIDNDQDGFYETILYYSGDDLVGYIDSDNANDSYDYSAILDNGNIEYEYYDSDKDSVFDILIKNTGVSEYEYVEKNSSIVDNIYLIGALAFLIFIFLLTFKKGKRAVSAILVFAYMLNMTFVYANDNVYNEDGTINEPYFEDNWIKYSSIDERIPVESRSYEAQQINSIKNDMQMCYERILLQNYDLGVQREAISKLKEDRDKLALDLKANLAKCTIRLAVITGQTIYKGKSYKGGLEKIYSLSANGLVQVREAVKIAQDYVPSFEAEKDQKIADSTKEFVGKLNTIHEVAIDLTTISLDELGAKTIASATESSINGVAKLAKIPNGDGLNITEEETNILKEQKLLLKIWDENIAKQSRVRLLIREDLKADKAFLERLRIDLIELYELEKENTRQLLIDAWKKNKDRLDDEENRNNDTSNEEEDNVIDDRGAVEVTVDDGIELFGNFKGSARGTSNFVANEASLIPPSLPAMQNAKTFNPFTFEIIEYDNQYYPYIVTLSEELLSYLKDVDPYQGQGEILQVLRNSEGIYCMLSEDVLTGKINLTTNKTNDGYIIEYQLSIYATVDKENNSISGQIQEIATFSSEVKEYKKFTTIEFDASKTLGLIDR